MSARSDWAVIMARGDSQRMGIPKGLCRLPHEEQTFLSRIMRLYRMRSCPVAIVTTQELARTYAGSLDRTDSLRWILRPRGQGTAATVRAAVADLAVAATHLWLHPVDLPCVENSTLQELERISRRESSAVIVPEFLGRPGHPVVLPTQPFHSLAEEAWPGAMRSLLEVWTRPGPDQVAAKISVPLTDQGIVTDFDHPAALNHRDAGAATTDAGDLNYLDDEAKDGSEHGRGDEGDEP